jgi:hypothetical protein
LDPLSYLKTQNRQELNRRSSDDVRLQRTKEANKEKERENELTEEELRSDVSTMSGDPLGDMDPDLFGGKDGPNYRPPEEEEERKNPEDDDEHPEEPEGHGGLEDDLPEPNEPIEEEAPADSPSPQHPAVEVASRDGQDRMEKVAAPVTEPASPEDHRLSSPSRETPAKESCEADPPEIASRESSTLSKPTKPTKPMTPGPAEGMFFDTSSGFLIAEQYHPDLADLLAKLIIGDPTARAYRKLQNQLAVFGRAVLRFCLQAGTKVYLLPQGLPLSSHPLLASTLPESVQGAAYLISGRACVFEEKCVLDTPYGFQPIQFYFAYAFDHALGLPVSGPPPCWLATKRALAPPSP